MRSKICKAKRKDNKEWVEGYYFCMVHDDRRHEHHFIIPVGADLSKGTPIEQIQVEIDIDTLCDDTGLTDKNGRKIWENDILKHYNKVQVDDFESYEVRVVTWNKSICRFVNYNSIKDEQYTVSDWCVYEVIGNVFDNPELLEKAR